MAAEYRVMKATTMAILEKKVTDAMVEGFRPHGSLVVLPRSAIRDGDFMQGATYDVYIQPCVKEG